jgi:predicted dehydrogenase
VQVAGVADINKKQAEALANKWQAESYKDYVRLLEREDIQAVSICMPDQLHRDPTVAAAEAGKHILLEKPIATDLEEAQEIIDATKNPRIKFMVAHCLRFEPRYLRIKEAVEQGKLGKLLHISAHRSSPLTEGPARYAPGTSLTYHVIVHDLDLINWYVQSKPVRVYAEGIRSVLKSKDMDDVVSALVVYENGTVANLDYGWILPAAFPAKLDARMEVIGSEGAAYLSAYPCSGLLLADSSGAMGGEVFGMVRGHLYGLYLAQIEHFVRCLYEDQEPIITPEEAFAAVKIASAIEESMKSGQIVSL